MKHDVLKKGGYPAFVATEYKKWDEAKDRYEEVYKGKDTPLRSNGNGKTERNHSDYNGNIDSIEDVDNCSEE